MPRCRDRMGCGPVGMGYRLAKAEKSGLAGREGGRRLAGIVAALDLDGDRTDPDKPERAASGP